MKKAAFVFVLLLFQLGCQSQSRTLSKTEKINLTAQSQIVEQNLNSNPVVQNTSVETQTEKSEYPGVTIDQKFPITANFDFTDKNFDGKKYSVAADDFQIAFDDFAPKTINKNGKTIFSFDALYPDDYHFNVIGISHLLGKKSKEIYVAAGGPGAVCCTNYWITDVSGEKPRNVFRSEDFGNFRDAMEIFDAEADGVYELVQFDSAFRYFMDDCGSCSPEPRAVFKYDKTKRTYLPAKNLQQDFVREYFLETEKWLAESFAELQTEEKPQLKLDYSRSFLAHVVDLFYLGEERKAWDTFDKFFIGYKEKEGVRNELKKRLKESKYFQALKKSGLN